MPPQPPEDDDDFELELEPVDPEIIAHAQARAQHTVESAVKKIDVDELYEGHSGYSDLELNLSGLKSFRFTTRTLLLITAILAIGMTVKLILGGCMAIFLGMVAAVALGWYWVSKLDRQQESERARRREDFFASKGRPAAGTATAPGTAPPMPASPFDPELPAAADVEPLEKPPFFDVKFAFSMQELFITMTAAAIAMGLSMLMPREYLAMILGFIALGGLVTNASGYVPPRLVVLGWWLLMVFYLAVSLFAATSSAGP
ncbi:hypothetical protein [Lacipirellula limnantheis]|uniref:Uncharacterized protein n=1 Tax=Lacipirellula limnantheis TaxID=2528024 RepID=A0A517U462_9BACT|nr:hypothetical protein [Lacipirellula limnantheis]QDT75414.1 hypothetical protein I41_46240 [Lacipirellula limnantheis]